MDRDPTPPNANRRGELRARERRDRQLHVMITRADEQILDELAARTGRDKSEAVRESVRSAHRASEQEVGPR